MKKKKLTRLDYFLILIILLMLAPVLIAGWKATYSELTAGNIADVDSFMVLDVSDTTMAATGTQKYLEFSTLKNDLDNFDEFGFPYGTAPTVDANAEAAVDTTADQLLYYSDALRVVHPSHVECVVVENLAAADDNYEIWMANDAVTITAIGVHCRGTCTTGADISLEDRSGNAMTHTTPTHSTGTDNTTWQSVTAANSLVAGEGLAFDVDNAVSPETDEYTICFTYTYNRQ